MQGILNILKQRVLINQFIRREISARYKGSYLGILWSIVTPLFMLTIYTFVFSVVFQAKWGTTAETNKLEFAVVLFAGLLVFNVFSEVISRSPSLILSNPNYVKKVVFPLEILPIVALGSALFHAMISLTILIVVMGIFMHNISWTILFFPLILIPFCLFTLGISWIIASLGVFIRDVGQIINIVLTGLMFLSPVFYPISSVPEELKFLYWLNPMTYVIEETRRVIIWGEVPHWYWIGFGTIIGFLVTLIGYVWFRKTRKGFADVI